jgi:hypothetical protein
MTLLALRMAARSNGVSRLHGEVSRRMWRGAVGDVPEDAVPIAHITNGVHLPTWLGAPMTRVLSTAARRRVARIRRSQRLERGGLGAARGTLGGAQRTAARAGGDRCGTRWPARSRGAAAIRRGLPVRSMPMR